MSHTRVRDGEERKTDASCPIRPTVRGSSAGWARRLGVNGKFAVRDAFVVTHAGEVRHEVYVPGVRWQDRLVLDIWMRAGCVVVHCDSSTTGPRRQDVSTQTSHRLTPTPIVTKARPRARHRSHRLSVATLHPLGRQQTGRQTILHPIYPRPPTLLLACREQRVLKRLPLCP
jgi:hypothetical protein